MGDMFKQVSKEKVSKLPQDSNTDNKKIIKDQEDSQMLKKAIDNTENLSDVPLNHIFIDLKSKGRLSMPERIHVRNFNTEESLEIGSHLTSLEEKKATIKLLNNIIHEDVDASEFTDDEIIEIMLTIYANYYGSVLVDYSYPINDEEMVILEERNDAQYKLVQKGESLKVDIKISDIDFKAISDEFQEPITLTDESGVKISFRHPRIKDDIAIQEYINKKFEKEDEEFMEIEMLLQEEHKTKKINKHVTKKQRHDYMFVQRNKALSMAKSLMGLCIVKYEGDDLKTLGEKLNIVKKVDISIWEEFQKVLDKFCNFGAQPNVKVKSPITGNSVERRFSFRPLDILQDTKLQGNKKYIVEFG